MTVRCGSQACFPGLAGAAGVTVHVTVTSRRQIAPERQTLQRLIGSRHPHRPGGRRHLSKVMVLAFYRPLRYWIPARKCTQAYLGEVELACKRWRQH